EIAVQYHGQILGPGVRLSGRVDCPVDRRQEPAGIGKVISSRQGVCLPKLRYDLSGENRRTSVGDVGVAEGTGAVSPSRVPGSGCMRNGGAPRLVLKKKLAGASRNGLRRANRGNPRNLRSDKEGVAKCCSTELSTVTSSKLSKNWVLLLPSGPPKTCPDCDRVNGSFFVMGPSV